MRHTYLTFSAKREMQVNKTAITLCSTAASFTLTDLLFGVQQMLLLFASYPFSQQKAIVSLVGLFRSLINDPKSALSFTVMLI